MSTLRVKKIEQPDGARVKVNDKNLIVFNDIVKDDDYAANADDRVWCNTVDKAWTLTLPKDPADYDSIQVIDYKASFDDNNLTVARNGSKIQGKDEDLTVDKENANFILQCIDSDWRILEGSI